MELPLKLKKRDLFYNMTAQGKGDKMDVFRMTADIEFKANNDEQAFRKLARYFLDLADRENNSLVIELGSIDIFKKQGK